MKDRDGRGTATMAALALAKLCWDTLFSYGLVAKHAAQQHFVTPAVEKIVEANTVLSGLGFESGGLAAAHAVHNGLTALPTTHEYMHGDKVNSGTQTQPALRVTLSTTCRSLSTQRSCGMR